MFSHNDLYPALEKTVLFVDGNPVGYTIHAEGDNYILEPAENPTSNVIAPVLQANCEHTGKFIISGTTDRDLLDQVAEDLKGLVSKMAVC